MSVQSEAEKFQYEVKKLSSTINSAGIDWHDDKYAKLSVLVGDIARKTKSVLNKVDNFNSKMVKFKTLSGE